VTRHHTLHSVYSHEIPLFNAPAVSIEAPVKTKHTNSLRFHPYSLSYPYPPPLLRVLPPLLLSTPRQSFPTPPRTELPHPPSLSEACSSPLSAHLRGLCAGAFPRCLAWSRRAHHHSPRLAHRRPPLIREATTPELSHTASHGATAPAIAA
jgi:hypothetical protein